MTTIVAVQTPDDVLLGWDSQLSRGNETVLMNEPKVWCSNGIVFGVSGSCRFMDILYAANFPDYDGSEPRKWIIRQFVPALLRNVEKSGHEDALKNEDGGIHAGLILVVDGTAFRFDGLFSPSSSQDGIYTMGSGGDYALGAIHHGATIYEAIEIATEIDPYSSLPVHVASANHLIATEPENPLSED